MAQMPEEGRKFGIVDSYWKDIMSEAVSSLLFLLLFESNLESCHVITLNKIVNHGDS